MVRAVPGKVHLADPIASVLGVELVERIGMVNLCDPKSYYLPKLKNVAVNLGTELDALEVGESGNFKALVSGEPIAVRPIYGAPYVISTTAKLWFLSNNLPRFKHGTDAELRRMRFLRFDKVPLVKDLDLKKKLLLEREGVLLWMLDGLMKLLELSEMPHGGNESKSVHDRFAISNDPLGTFITRQRSLDPQASVSKETFKNALKEFCEENGIPAQDDSWLFRTLWARYPELKEAQTMVDGRKGVRVVKGLTLI